MMYRIVRTDEFDGDAELLRAYFCAEDLIRIQKSSRSLCGYCLAVQMIREKIGNDFEIFFEKNGRPYISGEKIYFSISHSKDFAPCA